MPTPRRRRLAYDMPNTVSQEDIKPPRRNWRRIIKRSFLCLLVALIAFGGWTGYQLASKLSGSKNPIRLAASFIPSHLDQTNGRTNILLAGYSADDAGHSGANLTDSIMIVSVAAKSKKADIISVPRDLYVNIPGYGYHKINEAYQDGENDDFNEAGYAKGGMGLLEKTVEQSLGVHSHYYALINYSAFRDTVNAVGGVTVDIASQNAKGLYDPNANLRLSNGSVALNGEQALSLARARGDGYGSYGFVRGDFDRTEHQRQLLLALKDKVGSGSVLANPLKVANLANAVASNVKTDLKVSQLQTLGLKMRSISNSNISTRGLNDYDGKDLLTSYRTRSGQSALVPAAGIDDYSEIQTKIRHTLSN